MSGGVPMKTTSQPVFRAIADPTRRAILGHLSQRNMSIGEIADHFEMTRPAVRKHLTVLEEGDLIEVVARGRERINCLKAENLKPASDWMNEFSRFWDEKLANLISAVESNKENNDA